MKIRILGTLLEGTERLYEGPTVREALLSAAQDFVCCGHFKKVMDAFLFLKNTRPRIWKEEAENVDY